VLPSKESSLIGREKDLGAAARSLVAHRLLTLWGPAGIGKTRVALQLAHDAHSKGHGAVFVELSGARSSDAVRSLVADALAAHTGRSVDGRDAGALARTLSEADAGLVVLDNFEQCAEFADETVGRWLERPGPRFVVTSRERLRLRGEVCQEIEPLSLDGIDERPASLRLFCERAEEFGAPAPLGREQEDLALAICRALDGIPLAIELAAARVATLGLEGLSERLDRRLDTLAGAWRGAEPRQATLRGAIMWSWELLDEEEQLTLAESTVFRGSFEATAAEAILGPSHENVLSVLSRLRDKSLLRSTPDRGRARLSMFEMVRELAEEMAEPATVRADARRRHALYFSEHAANASAADRENVLTAIGELAGGDAGDVAVAATALLEVEERELRRGPVEDLVGLAREILDRLPSAEDPSRWARISAALGRASQIRGDLEGARAALEAARDVAEGRRDVPLLSSIVTDLGVLHHQRRALDDAASCYRRAIELERGSGQPHAQARLLGNLGALHHDQRQFEDAEEHYREALALLDDIGDSRLSGIVRTNAAVLWQERGDLDDAEAAYVRALSELEATPDVRLRGICLGNLASLKQERGDQEEALRLHRSAVETLASIGDQVSEGLARARLAGALASGGDTESARRQLARAERLTDGGDHHVNAAVGLHHAFIDVAEARALGSRDARARLTEARRRMDVMHEPAPDGRASPVECSDDVRLALRLLADRLGTAHRGEGPKPDDALLVAHRARRFRPPTGDWEDLSHHQVLRRILLALLEAHRVEPGRGLDVERLTRAAWPGERIRADAAANRVYVAIAKLRRRGLKPHLLRAANGYLLDPNLAIRRDA